MNTQTGGTILKSNIYLLNVNNRISGYIIKLNKNNTLDIYKFNKDIYKLTDNDYKYLYSRKNINELLTKYYKHFKTIKYTKLFQGNNYIPFFNINPNDSKTKQSRKRQELTNLAKGNTFLCLLSSNSKTNNYMFIGDRIYTFTTPKNEPITHYFGSLGNNNVVYPSAISNNNIYFLMTNPGELPQLPTKTDDMGILPLTLFKDFGLKGGINYNEHSYDKLWGINKFVGQGNLLKKLKPLANLKEVDLVSGKRKTTTTTTTKKRKNITSSKKTKKRK